MRWAVLVLLFGACNADPLDRPLDDGDDTVIAPRLDLGVGVVRPPDLAPANSMGCLALDLCINGCTNDACATTCYKQASPKAQRTYESVVNCIYDHCLSHDRCVERNGDFLDNTDAGAGVCERCLINGFAGLEMIECMPSNDPDCNPVECASDLKMCLAN